MNIVNSVVEEVIGPDVCADCRRKFLPGVLHPEFDLATGLVTKWRCDACLAAAFPKAA